MDLMEIVKEIRMQEDDGNIAMPSSVLEIMTKTDNQKRRPLII